VRDYILVIDDHLGVRKILARVLQQAGYQVETAENGRDAVKPINRSVQRWSSPTCTCGSGWLANNKVLCGICRDLPIIALSGAIGDNPDFLDMIRSLGATRAAFAVRLPGQSRQAALGSPPVHKGDSGRPYRDGAPSAQPQKDRAELACDFACDGRKDSTDDSEGDIAEQIAELRLDVGEHQIAGEKAEDKSGHHTDDVG
jgi:CheY-like chemotaxis protein